MGLILKNNDYNIKINSNKIIGVMGINYEKFLLSIRGINTSYIGKIVNFYTNSVIKEIKLYEKDDSIINDNLNNLSLSTIFLHKKISDL